MSEAEWKDFIICSLEKKEPSIEALKNALISAVKNQTKCLRRASILFSGGIDSSLIAFLVSKRIKDIILISAGVKNSKVFERAEKNANLLGLPLKKVILDKSKLATFAKELAALHLDRFRIQISLASYAAMKYSKALNYPVVFNGTGADELFAGYDKIRRALLESKDKALEAYKETLINFKDEIARESSIAKLAGVTLRSPYTDKKFMEEALKFELSSNIFSSDDMLRKHVLRVLAYFLGLPPEICFERKKAMQYDSGVKKLFSRIV